MTGDLRTFCIQGPSGRMCAPRWVMIVSSLNYRSHFKNRVLIIPSEYCVCTEPRKFHNDSMGSSKGPSRLGVVIRLLDTKKLLLTETPSLPDSRTFCDLQTKGRQQTSHRLFPGPSKRPRSAWSRHRLPGHGSGGSPHPSREAPADLPRAAGHPVGGRPGEAGLSLRLGAD